MDVLADTDFLTVEVLTWRGHDFFDHTEEGTPRAIVDVHLLESLSSVFESAPKKHDVK
jgi:hypothetical protein